MSLFANREIVTPAPSAEIQVAAHIAEVLPDPGNFLLELLSDLPRDALAATAAEIARARHANGSIPHASLSGIGVFKPKQGPLSLLATLVVEETIVTTVWASYGLARQDRRMVEATVSKIMTDQGVPAAATWAVASRPNRRMDVHFLGEQLLSAYSKSAEMITNGHVIKTFRKWQRS